MNTLTLPHSALDTNSQTFVNETVPLVDLKRMHLQSGLDPDDLQYLNAAPILPRLKGQTFRGVSIEP